MGSAGDPILPPVGEIEARAITAAGIQSTIATEFHCANGVAGILLAPVLDQDLLGPVIMLPLACSRDRRPLTTQPSAVGPGGVGHGSE